MPGQSSEAPHEQARTGDAIDSDIRRWVSDLMGRDVTASQSLVAGLGHRRFLRLDLAGPATGPNTVILRIDPPQPRNDAARHGVAAEPELEPIRALLERAGLPVPASYGRAPERGWDLLEDVGDRSLEDAVTTATAPERGRLYREAIGLIPLLQRIQAPTPLIAAFTRRLDAALIATKARKVIDWLLPESLGRPATAAERSVVELAFADVSRAVAAAPARLSHRDFKAANLHLRPRYETRGGAVASKSSALVLIDLQGAFLAPPEYDGVCLLRDSQVPLPESEVEAHLARLQSELRPELPDAPGTGDFIRRFDRLTITRVGKDLAHYLHAARESADDRYLGFVANGLANLQAASDRLRDEGPALGDLARLLADLPLPPICPAATPPAPPEARPCAR